MFLMKIANENYCVIQGWMLKIGCSNWNELAAYALVYGFSQDGQTQFVGSVAYIQEWLMCSKRNVSYIMTKLVEKGLLVKEQYEINGVKFNKYKAVVPPNVQCAKFAGVVQNLQGGSANFAPNNDDDNNNPPLYSPLTGGISPQGEIFPQSEIEEVEVEEVKKPKAKKKAKAAAIEFDLTTVQDDFKEIVSVWLEYKRKKQQAYKSQMSFAAMYQKLYKFSGGNAEVAKQIIEEAIGNNWAGFFPLKGNSAAQPKKSLEDSMRETERIYQERKRMKEEYGW